MVSIVVMVNVGFSAKVETGYLPFRLFIFLKGDVVKWSATFWAKPVGAMDQEDASFFGNSGALVKLNRNAQRRINILVFVLNFPIIIFCAIQFGIIFRE